MLPKLKLKTRFPVARVPRGAKYTPFPGWALQEKDAPTGSCLPLSDLTPLLLFLIWTPHPYPCWKPQEDGGRGAAAVPAPALSEQWGLDK